MNKLIDITGMRFGRFVVKMLVGKNKHNQLLWACRCDCGKEQVVVGHALRQGHSQSCGCLAKEIISKIHKNKIVSPESRHKMSESHKGKKLPQYIIDQIIERESGDKSHFYKHGYRQTRLYNIWCNMKSRCNNPNRPHYHRYGGKGIKVCDEWNNDFLTFKDWALSNGYSDDLTIDRIDSAGNYCPYNCQWITASENTTKRWREYRRKKKLMTV